MLLAERNIMEQQSVIHNTFVIERAYPAAPERVFDAFADPAKKRRWFVEGVHHAVEHFVMEFGVGGKERARFRFKPGTPLKAVAWTNEVGYLAIVAKRRIVCASRISVGAMAI